MSLRFETSTVADTPALLVTPASDPYELDLPDGASALIIGDPCSSAYVVTGSREELREFVAELAAELDD
ncbi:hypothetical protein GR925_27330 [Streptomyces sp. HUCO-GS316]|uniref:hypothetical protein n=1 Tax=Streptomyces sp. HUCO-GS316 TaxID=2692198 RepID=UPI001367F883|nr:hypothetical protein [Streptomyces sp. HUCO-GS316]MXM67041.1 hypothetical protein [Streptomyces sp. HUCO-GS316]